MHQLIKQYVRNETNYYREEDR